MATKVIMPQLGESVVEGTVTKWFKKEGERVEEYEALLEINTDKVDTEIPSPASGEVLKLYIDEGQTVKAGTLLAFIGTPGEAVPEAPELPQVESVEKVSAAETVIQPSIEAPSRPSKELGFISPVVARIASEFGIDLAKVRGSGRGGRITKKDVLAYIETGQAAPAAGTAPWEQPAFGELFRPTEEIFETKEAAAPSAGPAPGTTLPIDQVRKAIAEHMVRSKHTSPHVTTVMEVDLSRVVAHRQANKEAFARDGVNLTFSAYFVAAAVEALKAVPMVNASWSDDGIVLHQDVNIGVAVSLGDRGLIVPVIKGADQMSLRGLASAVNDLASRARERRLKPDDVQGGTFTITNHGVSGSLFATPIINQPQAAILGVGAIVKRVMVVEASAPTGETSDMIAIRPMAYLTLTFDHRILDGVVADHFLGTIVGKLQAWT